MLVCFSTGAKCLSHNNCCNAKQSFSTSTFSYKTLNHSFLPTKQDEPLISSGCSVKGYFGEFSWHSGWSVIMISVS